MIKMEQEDCKDVAEILRRRANEIAVFLQEYTKKDHLGSVELALTREIQRLSVLSNKIDPEFED